MKKMKANPNESIKKESYLKPESKVIELLPEGTILTGSPSSILIDDNYGEETIYNPFSTGNNRGF